VNLSTIVDIAVSGISAQRTRMAITASNLANAETTRTPEGGPYVRRDPVFRATRAVDSFADQLERRLRKVEVAGVVRDPRPPLRVHRPGHPDADADGMVALPRVNPVEELTNMMTASRSFQANVFVLRKVRQMAEAALGLGR